MNTYTIVYHPHGGKLHPIAVFTDENDALSFMEAQQEYFINELRYRTLKSTRLNALLDTLMKEPA